MLVIIHLDDDQFAKHAAFLPFRDALSTKMGQSLEKQCVAQSRDAAATKDW
jgi:hypothetical protein